MNDDLREQLHFMKEIESAIMVANREVIHQHIPPLSKDSVLGFAVSVSRVRAEYLKAVLVESHKREGGFSETAAKALKVKREQYEEAVQAFEALKHAIEMGYVELEPPGAEPEESGEEPAAPAESEASE